MIINITDQINYSMKYLKMKWKILYHKQDNNYKYKKKIKM